jgi:hypothetical protein
MTNSRLTIPAIGEPEMPENVKEVPLWTPGRIVVGIFFVVFGLPALIIATYKWFEIGGWGLFVFVVLFWLATMEFARNCWRGFGKYIAACPSCQKESQHYIYKTYRRSLVCPYCRNSWRGADTNLASISAALPTPEEQEQEQELNALRERISRQSDAELMRMVNVDFSEYRQEAIDLAKAELGRRGLSEQYNA